jgi:hypothetical protein
MGQYNAGVVVERSPCLPFETNVRPFGHHYIRVIPVRQGACESARTHATSFSPWGSFVFENYAWDKKAGDFARFNDKWIPSRVPLTALLSGAPLTLRILHSLHLTLQPRPCRRRPLPSIRAYTTCSYSRLLQGSMP